MIGIDDLHGELLQRRMPGEAAANQFPKPWPIALRTRRGMDADKSAATVNVILKHLALLLGVKRLVVAVGEYDRAELLEGRLSKNGRVIRDGSFESICKA